MHVHISIFKFLMIVSFFGRQEAPFSRLTLPSTFSNPAAKTYLSTFPSILILPFSIDSTSDMPTRFSSKNRAEATSYPAVRKNQLFLIPCCLPF